MCPVITHHAYSLCGKCAAVSKIAPRESAKCIAFMCGSGRMIQSSFLTFVALGHNLSFSQLRIAPLAFKRGIAAVIERPD
jgi:hypothetical protein